MGHARSEIWFRGSVGDFPLFHLSPGIDCWLGGRLVSRGPDTKTCVFRIFVTPDLLLVILVAVHIFQRNKISFSFFIARKIDLGVGLYRHRLHRFQIGSTQPLLLTVVFGPSEPPHSNPPFRQLPQGTSVPPPSPVCLFGEGDEEEGEHCWPGER